MYNHKHQTSNEERMQQHQELGKQSLSEPAVSYSMNGPKK